MTDSGTKCAWVIHGSMAVQIHEHNNCHCLYAPQVPDSVKNLHNKTGVLVGNQNFMLFKLLLFKSVHYKPHFSNSISVLPLIDGVGGGGSKNQQMTF